MKIYLADKNKCQRSQMDALITEMRMAVDIASAEAEAGRRRTRKAVERMRFNRLQ